jgi:hypothetical protein
MAETSREQEAEPVVFFDLTLGGMQLHFLEMSYLHLIFSSLSSVYSYQWQTPNQKPWFDALYKDTDYLSQESPLAG